MKLFMLECVLSKTQEELMNSLIIQGGLLIFVCGTIVGYLVGLYIAGRYEDAKEELRLSRVRSIEKMVRR